MPYKDREQEKKHRKEYYTKNSEKLKKRSRDLYHQHTPKDVQSRKKYKETHREELRKKARDYYWTHREKCLGRDSLRRKLYPEKKKESHKKYYAKHRDKILEYAETYRNSNKKKIRELKKQYAKEHPETILASKHRRRARENRIVSTLTASDINKILSFGCFVCGTYNNLTIAHDIPVVRGGNTTRGNTFCLCQSHNSSMGTKTFAEMFKQKELPL